MGFIPQHEIEQRLVSDGVRVVVVGEFGVGDVISLASRFVSTEDLKVGFDLLVYLFRFSIRLRVISSGKGKIVFQEFSKLLSEGGGKLRASVRDDFVIEAEVEVYFVEEKSSNPSSSNRFFCGTKNHPLSKPMVDRNQKGIKAQGRGKVGDKVTGDLLDRAVTCTKPV